MKSIQIVDDSREIRKTVRSAFESESGFKICAEAVDEQDAIQKAQQFKPDLIYPRLIDAGDEVNGITWCSTTCVTVSNLTDLEGSDLEGSEREPIRVSPARLLSPTSGPLRSICDFSGSIDHLRR